MKKSEQKIIDTIDWCAVAHDVVLDLGDMGSVLLNEDQTCWLHAVIKKNVINALEHAAQAEKH